MNYIKQIERYDPKTAKDEAIKRAILRFIEKNQDDVLTRINSIAHFTASSIILNEDSSKMLMIHHKIYNTWTWQGGHADGEEDLLSILRDRFAEPNGD